MMKARLTLCALALVLLGAFLMIPGSALAQINPTDVEGTCSFQGVDGTFDGTLDVTRFAVQNGRLVALGTLSGTCTSAGTVIGTLPSTAVSIPVNLADSTGTCQILDLVLGPLHLDILGLVVDLDTVHLEITAESGPGNLLGNLLCGIANLLNNNPGNIPLQTLATLLNRLLSLLG